MIELAAVTVMARRETLAGRVRDELAAAGLPIVVEAMLRTMTEILTAAGFTVRDSTNDFASFTLEIPDDPRDGSPWSATG